MEHEESCCGEGACGGHGHEGECCSEGKESCCSEGSSCSEDSCCEQTFADLLLHVAKEAKIELLKEHMKKKLQQEMGPMLEKEAAIVVSAFVDIMKSNKDAMVARKDLDAELEKLWTKE